LAELAFILLGALLVNNFVLAQFLGLCPFIGASGQYDTAAAMGLATTFVLTLAAAASWLVYQFILLPLDLTYLRIIAFIVVIAGTVQLTELYLKSTSPLLHQVLGIYLPLIKAKNRGIELSCDPNPNPEDCGSCLLEQIYGESSEETELLRYFRDSILSKTTQGKMIIRLYYQWSLLLVKVMKEDDEFKEEVKEMVDGVLELIEGEIE